MKNFSTTRVDHEERSFGSPFDPLLNGVAQGLAALFPPIENAHHPIDEDETGTLREVEDACPGE